MDRQQYQVAIIGGGIIGLSTALRLTERHPDCRVVVLEKEQQLAQHQTGHNSGVIHSGIYYAPGSSKAQFCTAGVGLLTQFCEENDIDFERCGKVIVATSESEFGRLDTLLQRGIANGVQGLEEIGPERLKEIEPHAFGLKAIWAPNTGIVDYKKVANAYADKIRASGGEIVTGATVRAIRESEGSLVVETTQGEVKTSHLINCAGLAADRVARMMGIRPNVRIIPFRGEYYTLKDDRRDLVKGLIYPVPNPQPPIPGRTLHQEDQRRGGGRPQRSPGFRAGGLHQDQLQDGRVHGHPVLRGLLVNVAEVLEGGHCRDAPILQQVDIRERPPTPAPGYNVR